MTEAKLKQPAPYTPAIVEHMVERLADVRGTILDPFAGPGLSLGRFTGPRRRVIGIEIEEPWAMFGVAHHTLAGTGVQIKHADSTKLPLRANTVAAIATSPVYPNRMTDHHRARDTSERRSYTHDIRTMTGDPDYELAANNAGRMSGGLSPEYRDLHVAVWRECFRVAREGCILLVNMSDSYVTRRKGERERIFATTWHLRACQSIGWEWKAATRIETPRMRRGQNGDVRADGEWVLEFTKEAR